MTESEFWTLIQEANARAANTSAIPEWLANRLGEFEVNEIWDFAAWEAMFLDLANDERLWMAGYLVCGGLSDDGFEYFKCWLIAQGEVVHKAAIANPDNLAELEYQEIGFFGPTLSLEGMLGVTMEAYNRKLKRPRYSEMERPAGYQPPSGCRPERTPCKNYGFLKLADNKTALATHFPKIMKRFCTERKDSGH